MNYSSAPALSGTGIVSEGGEGRGEGQAWKRREASAVAWARRPARCHGYAEGQSSTWIGTCIVHLACAHRNTFLYTPDDHLCPPLPRPALVHTGAVPPLVVASWRGAARPSPG